MRRAIALFSCLLLSVCGCRREPMPPRGLVIVVSAGLGPVTRELADGFQEQQPDPRISVESASSERILADTRQGLADIGVLGRPLRPSETGLKGFLLGREGIVLVVHRDNPVAGLSRDRAMQLLTRVATDWKDVGGSERGVVLIGEGKGAVREALAEHFGVNPVLIRPDIPSSAGLATLQAVSQQPGALAYLPHGQLPAGSESLPVSVRVLPLDGVVPTLESVRSGRYSLARPLVLLTRDEPTGGTREFMVWIRSQGGSLLGRRGVVPSAPQ